MLSWTLLGRLLPNVHASSSSLITSQWLLQVAKKTMKEKKLDYISTRLAMMTRELDFTLFMVSHVNDAGQTRGSRNISRWPMLTYIYPRDVENPDPEIRNTTNVMIKGNRFCHKSGPAAPLVFDVETYTLSEKMIYREGELP